MDCHAPILFLIFNRPILAKKVFGAIREAKPTRLFIAADGPRSHNASDIKNCDESREIIKQVDWDCDIRTLLQTENLGCRAAISLAIDWFFDNVDEGIILEDDCLPSQSFFRFCEEVLAKYRNDQRISHINGNCYLAGLKKFDESYYFSKLNGCWGWATWKRAWGIYTNTMEDYAFAKRNRVIKRYYGNKKISEWMESYFDEADDPTTDIWSSLWSYEILKQNGLCVTPTSNLVQNIGFVEGATTKCYDSFKKYGEFTPEDIGQIIHTRGVFHDYQSDNLHFNSIIKKTDPRLQHMFRKKVFKFLGKYS
jgi:hypothetical protein